jgi:hypothetical protein
MLSNNEFIMNSNAVKKYGTGFFNALNQKSIPPEIVQGIVSGLSNIKSGIQAYSKGGFVVPGIRGFANGGSAMSAPSPTPMTNVSNSYVGNFTINGAGKQAKEIAIEVDRILTQRSKYNRSNFYNAVKR